MNIHLCDFPAHHTMPGTVWVCTYCGWIWECLAQYKSQTPAGPVWVAPGKWTHICDTKGPQWARDTQREVRQRKLVAVTVTPLEELTW